MSLSFPVPSFESLSGNDAIKRTDSTTVNGQEIAVWHYDNTRDDLPETATSIRGVVSVGQSTRGFFQLTREIVVFEDDERKQASVDAVDALLGESPDLNAITVYEALEGACLLRVFNPAGQWFVSTNQKLDASNSRWTAAKNFRQQFQDALWWIYRHSRAHDLRSTTDCSGGLSRGEHAEFWKSAPELPDAAAVEEWFFSTLDPERGYAFLVRPTVENKNFFVSEPNGTPMLYNVGVFADSGSTLLYNEPVPGVPKPAVVAHPTEPSDPDFDLLSWLFNKTSKSPAGSRQGLMVFTADTHFKLVSHEYHYKAGLRENNTVLFQYVVYNMNLQLVPDDQYESYKGRWEDFRALYEPVWGKDFQQIDNALQDVVWALAKAYYARNKPRNRDLPDDHPDNQRDSRRLHQPEFKLVMKLHSDWRESEDPETGRKRYRIFRRHNPDQQNRGRRRQNSVYVHDPDTGMEYHMDAIWHAMYHQEPRNVYQMVSRRLRFGDNWTVYQPESSANNRRSGGNRRERQSFGRQRQRMVGVSRRTPAAGAAAE